MPPKQQLPKKSPAPVNPSKQAAKTIPVNHSRHTASTKTTASKTSVANKGKQPGANSSKTKVESSTVCPPPINQLVASQQLASKNWTPEDVAATKIQTLVRQILARRQLQKKKMEQLAYEEQMERLEREAYAKMVKMYQEEMEIERRKEEEEKRKLQQAIKRRKRILDAAFEGDNAEILAVLKEVRQIDDKDGVGNDVVGRARRAKNQLAIVDCTDANNNTPLSEAASGGHVDTIKLLVENNADPNSRGHFQRTPLYRAAFAGHLDAVQILLQFGADPRLYADDGQTPGQLSSFEPVRALLESWDISQTENYLKKLEADRDRRRAEQQQSTDVQAKQLEDQVEAASKEYGTLQKKLIKATEELNKRIHEHDKAIAAGHAKIDVTLQMIHDAEMDVELVRVDVEKARNNLARLRLALRDKRAEFQGKDAKSEETFQSLQVLVKELDDVLLRDVGDRIKTSPKWPLIIDSTGRAAMFLRYRDTNYLNALNPQEMQSERIRMAVLGSVRFGKPLVLDMMEVDMYDACERRFGEVQHGLLSSIMNKSITSSEVYESLIRPTDGVEYSKHYFNPVFTEKFRFFIVTKNPCPPTQLIEMTYPITVIMPI